MSKFMKRLTVRIQSESDSL